MAEAQTDTAKEEKQESGKADERPPFRSSLGHGRGRFLAHTLVHGFEIGLRREDDFIRHFPPKAIMEGLADRPSLRANILAETIGVNKRVATKKSWESAGEDLDIALQLRETDPATIVRLFEPDDRVRYLDAKKLWGYVIEGSFWQAKRSDKDGLERAKQHIGFMLERALIDELITHRDILEGLTVDRLCEILPRPKLAALIAEALDGSHSGRAFSEVDFLRAVPPADLVEHVPLPTLWDQVVVPKIAEAHGFVDKPEPEPEPEMEGKPEAEPAAGKAKAEKESAPEADRAEAKAEVGQVSSADTGKEGTADANTAEAGETKAEEGPKAATDVKAEKGGKADGDARAKKAKTPAGALAAAAEPVSPFDDKTTESTDPRVRIPDNGAATAAEIRVPPKPAAPPAVPASDAMQEAFASVDAEEIDVEMHEVFDDDEDTQRGLKLDQILSEGSKSDASRRSGSGRSKKKKKA